MIFENLEEEQYLDHLAKLEATGIECEDRTNTGTFSIFGHQMRFSLKNDKFPMLTTKKVHFPSVAHELLWFVDGDTNIKYLKDNNVRIWDEWADENGELGPVYGHQWRNFAGGDRRLDYRVGIDQLQNCVDQLRDDPDSRRIIVSSWNPHDLPNQALPPCHNFFQFKSYVIGGDRHLSLQMYQRSADWFLGVPFNIASYALLLRMVAKITGHVPNELIMSFGDTHLYGNHLVQAEKQLARTPSAAPSLVIHGEQKEIDDFTFADFELVGYNPQKGILAPVAV